MAVEACEVAIQVTSYERRLLGRGTEIASSTAFSVELLFK